MLELKNVTKTFFAGTANEKKALRGVSFTLEDGDFCTVIGSNGAGKSTTLNAIAGAFPIDSGSILIDGVDVSRMPEYKRAAFIGRVFQDPMHGRRHDDFRKPCHRRPPRPQPDAALERPCGQDGILHGARQDARPRP